MSEIKKSAFRERATPKAPLIIGSGAAAFLGLPALEPQLPKALSPLLYLVALIGFGWAVFGLTLWKPYWTRRLSTQENAGAVGRVANRAAQKVRDVTETEREKQRASEEEERAFYARIAPEYGALTRAGQFDGRRIEIFEKGYVRVGSWHNTSGGPYNGWDSSAYTIPYDAPFEKLRGIKCTTQIQDKSAGGRALAAKATGGLSRMASNEKRIVFLTITTDVSVHTLKTTGGMLRGEDTAAMALEAAGQGVLDSLVGPGTTSPARATPPASVSDHLKDLASLHSEGLLSDAEFAAAKAKLLEQP